MQMGSDTVILSLEEWKEVERTRRLLESEQADKAGLIQELRRAKAQTGQGVDWGTLVRRMVPFTDDVLDYIDSPTPEKAAKLRRDTAGANWYLKSLDVR